MLGVLAFILVFPSTFASVWVSVSAFAFIFTSVARSGFDVGVVLVESDEEAGADLDSEVPLGLLWFESVVEDMDNSTGPIYYMI